MGDEDARGDLRRRIGWVTDRAGWGLGVLSLVVWAYGVLQRGGGPGLSEEARVGRRAPIPVGKRRLGGDR